jgi:hypothetical protein
MAADFSRLRPASCPLNWYRSQLGAAAKTISKRKMTRKIYKYE